MLDEREDCNNEEDGELVQTTRKPLRGRSKKINIKSSKEKTSKN